MVIPDLTHMKKILLVNSQESFLDRNKTLLNRAGFLILTATSADEAIRICREHEIQLVIAQLELSGTGGDLLCSLLRQDSALRNLSIILVCFPSEAAFAALCGANAVVTKPVRPDELLQLVGKFLGIRARREYRAEFRALVEGTWGTLTFSGMTRNISASGLLCETEVLLNRDDLLSNMLFSLDSSQIVAEAQVIWRAGGRQDELYSYGVQFVNLAPQLRDKIEQFVTDAESKAQ
jgi:CheY-like chemotaxis protein